VNKARLAQITARSAWVSDLRLRHEGTATIATKNDARSAESSLQQIHFALQSVTTSNSASLGHERGRA
jgi:hypothetical protein